MSTESPLDDHWMQRALTEAKAGYPSPNPHVGAVVAAGETLVAVGHHERAGEDHAEVAALKAAGGGAKGATLYVTLEPCNHEGRTGPCTQAILRAGIKRVVIGCADPNPNVQGGGIDFLRANGVEVIIGPWTRDAEKAIAPWTKFVTLGLPYVSLKLALSLDGRIATRTGASRWVTGPEARARVHTLRAEHDACAVGIGTALTDDPRLTVRDAPGLSPVRVVFDTKLRLPTSSKLAQTAKTSPTWVIAGTDAPTSVEDQLVDLGLEIVRVHQTAEGRVDLRSALERLASLGIVSMMVEGGAELAGSFLAGRFADDLHAFVAPTLFGPRGRPGAVDWAGPDVPEQAPRLIEPTWELCGDDAHVFGLIDYEGIAERAER